MKTQTKIEMLLAFDKISTKQKHFKSIEDCLEGDYIFSYRTCNETWIDVYLYESCIASILHIKLVFSSLEIDTEDYIFTEFLQFKHSRLFMYDLIKTLLMFVRISYIKN